MADEIPRRVELNRDTAISVSLLAAIVGGAVWATRLDATVKNMEVVLGEIKTEVSHLRNGIVSEEIFRTWIRLLRAQNPTLTIPELP